MSPLFLDIAEFCMARGAKSIKDVPGCYEAKVDEHWWIAVNGHAEPAKTSTGVEVPPFAAYIEFNGWPAGVVDPAGGLLAAGELANETTFRAALKAAA